MCVSSHRRGSAPARRLGRAGAQEGRPQIWIMSSVIIDRAVLLKVTVTP